MYEKSVVGWKFVELEKEKLVIEESAETHENKNNDMLCILF